MSDATLDIGLVPRGDAAAEIKAATDAVRDFERERRIRHLVTVGGGWFMAGIMSCVATAALGVMWHRPIPRDLPFVLPIHDNGVYDAPILRDDLPQSMHDLLLRHTFIRYIIARENYTWEAIRKGYRTVSAMSTPEERDRYQAVMNNPKSPDNPAMRWGTGSDAATVDVEAIQVTPDKATPNAVDAVFIVKITAPGKQPQSVRRTARLVWADAADKILPEIQQLYDPAGIAIVHYSSTDDPGVRQ